MIAMALLRMNHPVRRAEASLFREDILTSQAEERARASKAACHIGKLPVEILWVIMLFAAHDNPSFVFSTSSSVVQAGILSNHNDYSHVQCVLSLAQSRDRHAHSLAGRRAWSV